VEAWLGQEVKTGIRGEKGNRNSAGSQADGPMAGSLLKTAGGRPEGRGYVVCFYRIRADMSKAAATVLTHESGSSKISMLPEGIQIFFVAI
jgi:hypothetical protein